MSPQVAWSRPRPQCLLSITCHDRCQLEWRDQQARWPFIVSVTHCKLFSRWICFILLCMFHSFILGVTYRLYRNWNWYFNSKINLGNFKQHFFRSAYVMCLSPGSHWAQYEWLSAPPRTARVDQDLFIRLDRNTFAELSGDVKTWGMVLATRLLLLLFLLGWFA